MGFGEISRFAKFLQRSSPGRGRHHFRWLIQVSLFFGLAVIAHADEEVIVEGVRFACPDCAVFDGSSCGVPEAGAVVVVPCNEVFDHLLQRVLQNRLPTPSSRELVQYLNREQVSPARIKVVAQLFEQRNAFAELATHEISAVIRRYPETFQELLMQGWGSAAVNERLWRIFAEDRSVERAPLRAVLLGRTPLGRDELLRVIQIEEPAQDLALLQEALAVAQQHKTAHQDLLASVATYIEQCLDKANPDSALCDLQRIVSELPEAKGYFTALYINRIGALLDSNDTPIDKKVLLLASVPQDAVRASDIRIISTIALKAFLRNSSGITRPLLDQSRLMELLARNPTADGYVLDQVQRLMRRIETQEQLPDSQHELEQAAHVLAVKTEARESNRRLATQLAIGLAAFLSSIALFRWFFLFRRRRIMELAPDILATLKENHELTELLQYFKLPPDASSEDARKAYRELARKHHPDRSSKDGEKFIEVQEKYERIKQLLDER